MLGDKLENGNGGNKDFLLQFCHLVASVDKDVHSSHSGAHGGDWKRGNACCH